MPRTKCPDPALLQAYADATLFSRDVPAIEQHVAGCQKCAAVLTAIRQERDRTASSSWSRPRVTGAAIAAVVVAGFAAWTMRPGTGDALLDKPAIGTQPEPSVPVAAPAESSRVESPASTPAPAAIPDTKPVTAPKTMPPPPKSAAPAVTERARPVEKTPPPRAEAAGVNDVPLEGVVLRGTRRSTRRIVWRALDFTVEHSTDGGMTWVTEHTTDRAIRAGSFVSADVAWLVGDSGLVLRRTKNGWFGATPPADGDINAIRASSSSKATVTLGDGRVFTTENGGVTWSLQ
jgi:hypothetical protein